MIISTNIKFLRNRRGFTQEEVAKKINIKRSTLSGYENMVAEPDIETLKKLSGFYQIPVDMLISASLADLPESHLAEIEKEMNTGMSGKRIRILATTVDPGNNENIELVPEKAKAGYATGYADPEYVSSLPVFQLPFLSRNRKYRAFEISGDSMYPIPEGSWVIGEYMLDMNMIKTNQAYIILTADEGIVFKVVENLIQPHGLLVLHSLNPVYSPYEVPIDKIVEVWRFVSYITTELPSPALHPENLIYMIDRLRNEVNLMKQKIGNPNDSK